MSLEGCRADRSEVTGIASERRGDGTYLMYPGTYGAQTLLKEVHHYTMCCPECGTIGRYDYLGDVICDDPECAVVISSAPPLIREDFGEGGAGHGLSDVATATGIAPAEPDVQ